jgi:nucleoside-triphosphatase THEP1
MLAIMSVYLMIAFVQIWDDRGLIWRAGLICALMKSVSPSAVILGPMTGILLEALLLEAFIRLFGRNLFGYLVGGAVAVASSLIHKAATLLVLYGFDLVRILGDLYRFSVRQVNLEGTDPLIVIGLVTGIYMVSGMAGAAGGYLAGKAYIKKNQAVTDDSEIDLSAENMLFRHTSPRRYSIIALLANLVMIILSMTLLNTAPLIPAISAGAAYALVVFLYYKNTLNKLRKPAIWIQFILIAIVSAFLWNSATDRGVFDLTGLAAGLKMIWRALIIITGFSAVSIEMKNPLIKSILYNRGFANLYQSLTLAFSALPSVISRLPAPDKIIKSRNHSFGHLFKTAETLLPLIETENSSRPDIFILTGERLAGKTTFLKELIRIIRERGLKPAGFVSEGIHDDKDRVGFNLTDIETGAQTVLCSTGERPGMLRQGRFWFSSEALKTGEEIISNAVASGAPVIVIDEVGPLEISGKGWHDAIERAVSASDSVQVWTVRTSLVNKASRRWNTGTVTVVDTVNASPEEIADLIAETSEKPAENN